VGTAGGGAPGGALAALSVGPPVAGWQFAPAVTAGVAVLACGYLAGVRRIARRHPARPWRARWSASFLAGLAVVTFATESGIGRYDDTAFSVHMVQHLLLIMVAPPLLVAGRPATLLLHAAGNPVHGHVRQVLRSGAMTALTSPPAVFGLYALVVAGTHTPPVMDTVVRDPAAHDAEHAAYLLAGYLFFLLVNGSEPIRWRLSMPARYLLLLAAMQVDTVTGVLLMVAGHEVFPVYAHAAPRWGSGPLADLHRGGLIMFAGSDLVMTVAAMAVLVAFLRGRRDAGRAGNWAEAARRRALARNLAASGIPAPAAGTRHTVDDDAHLAAYNAYLSALAEEPPVT
jgi:cytochrome c oxidase assembly factor CtaG